MATAGDDTSVVHYQDPVHLAYRRKPMRDNQRGARLHQLFQGVYPVAVITAAVVWITIGLGLADIIDGLFRDHLGEVLAVVPDLLVVLPQVVRWVLAGATAVAASPAAALDISPTRFSTAEPDPEPAAEPEQAAEPEPTAEPEQAPEADPEGEDSKTA